MTEAPERRDPDPAGCGGEPCRHRLEIEARARRYLESLGRADHQDAAEDPVYALFQIAADCRAQANGYRELYERLKSRGADAGDGTAG